MKIMFYKARTATVLYVNRFLTKILFVDTPPIFSVAALIVDRDKLLFVDHSYSNGIGLPGGVISENENLEKALQREVFEETGLDVKDSTYFGSFSSFHKGVPTASVVFVVKAEGKLKGSDEGKLIWLTPEESLGKFTYKDNEKTIKKFLQLKS